MWSFNLAFGSFLSGATNMKPEEMSVEVKEAIVNLGGTIREMAKTLGAIKSSVCLKKKDIRRSGKPQKTTEINLFSD